MNDGRRWLWVSVIVGAYGLSLFLPADRVLHMSGAQACLMFPLCLAGSFTGRQPLDLPGLLGAALVYFCPNVMFVFGVLLLALRRYRLALAAGVAAAVCACYFFLLMSWLNVGYFVWLGSILLLALTGACFAFIPKGGRTEPTFHNPRPPALPDPSVLELFLPSQTMGRRPADAHSGARRDEHVSSFRPPCSPSS